MDEHRIRAQSEIEIVHCRHALKDIYLPGLGEIIKDIVSFLIQPSLRVLGYCFLVFSKPQQLVIFADCETIHRCFEEDISGFVGVSLGFNRERRAVLPVYNEVDVVFLIFLVISYIRKSCNPVLVLFTIVVKIVHGDRFTNQTHLHLTRHVIGSLVFLSVQGYYLTMLPQNGHFAPFRQMSAIEGVQSLSLPYPHAVHTSGIFLQLPVVYMSGPNSFSGCHKAAI